MDNISFYTADGSNSSQRVEWALRYKTITYNTIQVSANELKSSYLSINPYGYVPALCIDGKTIAESMAIVEYIEECFPKPTLMPDSPYARAKVRQICEYVNSTIHAPQNRSVLQYLLPELEPSEKPTLRGEWIAKGLTKLTPQLWQKTSFAVEDRFTLADIFVACIYKKGIAHGMATITAFDRHLTHLRSHSEIKNSEPH